MVDGNNKAVEFVKEHGWFFSKLFADGWFTSNSNCDNSVSRDKVGDLVNSYELVLTRGGLPMAKADMLFLDAYEKESPYWVKMADAIKDVESCL